MAKKVKEVRAKDPDVLTHACPDAVNPVVFELTRVYED